jgi:transposase
MSIKCEYETRKKALGLYRDGMGFMEIIRTVHRSGFWLAKWLRRYRKFGFEGLRDQRRVPRHIPNQTPESLVRKILALRDELAAYRTRRAACA